MSLSSSCAVCKLKITRNRTLYNESKTCAECFSKINSGEYVINVNSNSVSVDTSSDNDSGSEIIEQKLLTPLRTLKMRCWLHCMHKLSS